MRALALMLWLPAAVLCETVLLRTGVSVEGEILGKSDAILKVYVSEFQRAITIERDKIERIVAGDDTLTFDQFLMKQERAFNPRFRPVPRRERASRVVPVDTSTLKTDLFEIARRENVDSVVQDNRRLNLLFNAPARWGSFGMGYFQIFHLRADDPRKFSDYGFAYNGEALDVRCLDAQIRRNFRGGLGSIVVDLGYGKHLIRSDATGGGKEAAMVRYMAVRYVLCKSRWLFSPGLSAGAMLARAGVIRYAAPSATDSTVTLPAVDLSLYDHSLRPLIGLDLNFYDVVAANLSLDLLRFGGGRFCASLAFLLPFLQ